MKTKVSTEEIIKAQKSNQIQKNNRNQLNQKLILREDQ